MSGNATIRSKVRRLAGDDIRVETYADLHSASVKYYNSIDKRLRSVAPEYARGARKKASKKKAKKKK